ncbi:thioredoxin family protein [Rudanella lutea]|jgi:thiol:disulfide interchange protein|uniref:thioredoxin family protein n=1 Tax=Rudanella lutea TaxID=451374 RepID=UPI000361135C|nr:thioredoxin fold domain-containing protein [Rudanella lutea]
MKKAIWLPFALLLLVASTTWAGNKNPKADEGIRFNSASWAEVLKKAKAENRLIFLDAYASWCGPCKMLQKNVFTQKEVGDYFNKKFINVKIDMERGEGPMLAQRYPLEAYPTLFFINGNGKVVKKAIGYMSPDELLNVAKSVTGKGL